MDKRFKEMEAQLKDFRNKVDDVRTLINNTDLLDKDREFYLEQFEKVQNAMKNPNNSANEDNLNEVRNLLYDKLKQMNNASTD